MHAPALMCTCISACAYTCQVSGKLISYDKAQEIQHQRHYNIFLNMIHKGFVYLEAVKQGRIVLNNAETPVMTLGNSPKAIVTMFYANDPLVFFHAVLYNVLRTQHILRTSNLNENIDSLHLWSEGTPDVSSEKTALVAQTSVLPRRRADP